MKLPRANFFNGKEAIMYLETIELPQVESGATFKYGIFGFPDIPSGKGDKGFVTGAPEGFVILKNTKYPKEALEFPEVHHRTRSRQGAAEGSGLVGMRARGSLMHPIQTRESVRPTRCLRPPLD